MYTWLSSVPSAFAPKESTLNIFSDEYEGTFARLSLVISLKEWSIFDTAKLENSGSFLPKEKEKVAQIARTSMGRE